VNLCACLTLDGTSSANQRDGFALLGVGELRGITAVEHYRCMACGGEFSRVLLGEPRDRIWQSLPGCEPESRPSRRQ
jgi:hypothetical protein